MLDFIPEDFEDLDAMAAELEKAPAPPSRVPPRGVRGAPLCPPRGARGGGPLRRGARPQAFGNASDGGRLASINFARLADNLAGIAFRFPFRIPACVPRRAASPVGSRARTRTPPASQGWQTRFGSDARWAGTTR